MATHKQVKTHKQGVADGRVDLDSRCLSQLQDLGIPLLCVWLRVSLKAQPLHVPLLHRSQAALGMEHLPWTAVQAAGALHLQQCLLPLLCCLLQVPALAKQLGRILSSPEAAT